MSRYLHMQIVSHFLLKAPDYFLIKPLLICAKALRHNTKASTQAYITQSIQRPTSDKAICSSLACIGSLLLCNGNHLG